MYTMKDLIIVDDEILEANCLKDAILWNNYDLSVADCFDNVPEALDYIENHNVDVIISDIKMPHIDGLEFCRRVRETHPEIVFIFISAHKEFSYAKSAIELQVFDYITKPIDISQLENTCIKLMEHLKTNYKDYPSIPLEVLHFQQILVDYLTDITSIQELESELKSKGFPSCFTDKNLAYISVVFNGFVEFLTKNPAFNIDKTYAFVLNSIEVSEILIVPLIYTTNGFKALALSLNDLTFDKNLQTLCEKSVATGTSGTALNITTDIIKKYIGLAEFKENSNISAIVSLPGVKNDSFIVSSAKQYIKDNYMHDISLFDIANHVSVTPYHFCRVFKKETNVNFTSFLNDVRINRAKQLLIETNLNNDEICNRIGINSVNYFYQLFKSFTGFTPHTFRKNNNRGGHFEG